MIQTLPYERRDHYPVMSYPMPWAAPVLEDVAAQMTLNTPAGGRPKAVYMHIPFCEYLCGFCPFVKYPKDEARIARYLVDLKNEIAFYAETPRFSSVTIGSMYMGGGTASVLSPAQLVDIIGFTKSALRFEPDAEITLECNPRTVSPEKFAAVRATGVNRVSFGVQTFNDEIGKATDVAQSGATSRQVVEWALEAGIDNVSIDLIYNLPGQTGAALLADLDTALAIGVKQITLFPLSVMPHTRLFRDITAQKVEIGALHHELDLATLATGHLAERGLLQTTTSDFSWPGITYRHAQIHFCDFEDLLGVGAGAMGCINEYTYVNVAELNRYTELTGRRLPPINAGQPTPEEERTRATMAVGLRMRSVERETFQERHGCQPEDEFGDLLDQLQGRGLIECTPKDVRLTDLGTLFGYDVAKEFYSDTIRAHGQRLAEALARKRDVVQIETLPQEQAQ
jgi:oxygen-independent coproporphyrinogen-3 oxidase